MKHLPNGTNGNLRFANSRHAESAGTVEDCISCHIYGGHNLLARGLEILAALANRKRSLCQEARQCGDTGLALVGNGPPHTELCECRLTEDIARTLLEILEPLEGIRAKAAQLSRMVDPDGDPQVSTGPRI